jgi:predicted RNA binding protein YcfA (HicA-like mRNA interferase family)
MPFTPREVIARLKRAGFDEVRQTGSHLFLRHPDGRLTFVAMHRGDIPAGTMRKILKQAHLTESQFEKI